MEWCLMGGIRAFGFVVPKINTLPTSPGKLSDKLVGGFHTIWFED